MMLKVNQAETNLGTLVFGKPHNFKYTLTNDSPESVVINKLVLGCSSCTKAYTSKTYLRSGESSDVNVTFTPGSKGKQLKTINVIYNNINELVLKFTAHVD